jgi:hypothetical protein
MATRSVIPATKQKIIDLLNAKTLISDSKVQVAYSTPANLERESIYFYGVRFRHDLPVMRAGRKPRDEDFVLLAAIAASSPGNSSREAEERAFVLLGELEDILADDPKLDGTVEWSKITESDGGNPEPDAEGWDGLIRVAIECKARLT